MGRPSRELLNLVTDLMVRQPWLRELAPALDELIALCDDYDEHTMVCQLLERFLYLRDAALRNAFRELAKAIVSKSGFSESETIVAAMSYDAAPDSGQAVVTGLRPHLVTAGWRDVRCLNRVGATTKRLGEGTQSNLVIVDEFVGTGRTARNRVDWLQKSIASDYGPARSKSISIHIGILAGMESGLAQLEEGGLTVHVVHRLKAGLRGWLVDEDYLMACYRMLRLELELSDSTESGEPLPNFGYGCAEALYAADIGQVPNSVFPIFWWPELKDGTSRRTLLVRAVK